MKNKIYVVILGAIFLFSIEAQAQLPYALTVYTNTYTSLTGATNINGSTVWDYYYNFSAPTGFDYKMDTFTVHQFNFAGMESMWTDTARTISYHPWMSSLGFTDAAFTDKGTGTSTSLSPISYVVTGAAGHRIFKMEISNAGFALEKLNHGTLNDYVNVQFWVYEDSSIIEIHYGPSLISYPDYFLHGTGPMVWYALDWPLSNDGDGYVLQGSPSAPTIKKVPFSGGVAPITVTTLSSWPANGTVFRFGPGTTGIEKLNTNKILVYPTLCFDQISFENPNNNIVSYDIVSINGANTEIKGVSTRNKTELNISSLPNGEYILELNNSSEKTAFKFIKL